MRKFQPARVRPCVEPSDDRFIVATVYWSRSSTPTRARVVGPFLGPPPRSLPGSSSDRSATFGMSRDRDSGEADGGCFWTVRRAFSRPRRARRVRPSFSCRSPSSSRRCDRDRSSRPGPPPEFSDPDLRLVAHRLPRSPSSTPTRCERARAPPSTPRAWTRRPTSSRSGVPTDPCASSAARAMMTTRSRARSGSSAASTRRARSPARSSASASPTSASTREGRGARSRSTTARCASCASRRRTTRTTPRGGAPDSPPDRAARYGRASSLRPTAARRSRTCTGAPRGTR